MCRTSIRSRPIRSRLPRTIGALRGRRSRAGDRAAPAAGSRSSGRPGRRVDQPSDLAAQHDLRPRSPAEREPGPALRQSVAVHRCGVEQPHAEPQARSMVATACACGTAENIPPIDASPNPSLLTVNPVRPSSTIRMPPTLKSPTDTPPPPPEPTLCTGQPFPAPNLG